MNEVTARTIYEHILALDPLLDKLSDVVDEVGDDDLRRQFKKAVGDVMGILFSEMMYPIERRFPDLMPQKERPATKVR